jgi:hypothetical protein
VRSRVRERWGHSGSWAGAAAIGSPSDGDRVSAVTLTLRVAGPVAGRRVERADEWLIRRGGLRHRVVGVENEALGAELTVVAPLVLAHDETPIQDVVGVFTSNRQGAAAAWSRIRREAAPGAPAATNNPLDLLARGSDP